MNHPFFNLQFPYINVQYTNNTEYRKVFRKITNMNTTLYVDEVNTLPDIDAETLDEYNYDDTASVAFLDKVCDLTLDYSYLVDLYKIAAARMFSTDPEIGITILMSYDFLYLYYPMLCVFSQSPSTFTTDNIYYVKLMKKLS